jgi:hypothetical protein
MQRELATAREEGRTAKVTVVERRFGIPHATFSRNYRDLIDWFRTEASGVVTTSTTDGGRTPSLREQLQRARRENRDLRATVEIYAAEIQRLTIDNETLRQVIEGDGRLRPLR